MMNVRTIAVELQSLGVRVPDTETVRKGGAGPAEGQVLIFQDHFISVPSRSAGVSSSPYEIKSCGTSLALYWNGAHVGDVSLPPRPRYYDLKTSQGVLFDKLALIHGRDCLASTLYQDCRYWNTRSGCLFCGIGLSLTNGRTVLEKQPEDLALVAEKALLLDTVSHVTLTTGMRESEKATIDHVCACVKAIKGRTPLPVHVQIGPPETMDYLEALKISGADTVGIHIESFDSATLRRVAPAKAGHGWETYRAAWKYAVSLFGRNQVSSFLVAGLGEDAATILSGAEMLCELGVYPYLLPFRPIPGTPMETMKPPAPEKMVYLYEQVAPMLKKYGLSSRLSMAGCVRCGACSALSLFEEL